MVLEGKNCKTVNRVVTIKLRNFVKVCHKQLTNHCEGVCECAVAVCLAGNKWGKCAVCEGAPSSLVLGLCGASEMSLGFLGASGFALFRFRACPFF